MYWNYRLINMPSINDGDDHITLKEVHYNDDDTVIGVCDPCTFCETAEYLPTLKEHIMLAWDNPVLHESELPTNDDDDVVIDDASNDSLAWLKDAMANGISVNM